MTLIDGRPLATLPSDDRGLHYGDGLFETMRAADGCVPLLARHLARLRDGCGALGIVAPSDDDWAADLDALGLGAGPAVVKLLVTRGGGGRGYAPSTDATPRRIVQRLAPQAWPADHARDGIELALCPVRLAVGGPLAGLKHLNRLEQVLGRRALAASGAVEGVMCDLDGAPISGTMTNLFLTADGRLATPSLTRCGVRGVARGLLIELATALGIGCEERAIALHELATADELLVCNSVVGIWPVRRHSGRTLVPGPITRALQAALAGRGLPS